MRIAPHGEKSSGAPALAIHGDARLTFCTVVSRSVTLSARRLLDQRAAQ